jgi:hypothetical protein
MSKPLQSWVLTVALSLSAVAAVTHFVRMGADAPWRRPAFDFTAFYCAGRAVDAGRNPYTYEPLHACEHRVNATRAFRNDRWLVVPAPQPPHDLAILAPFACLPFAAAQTLYTAIIVALALICAAALCRMGIALHVALLGFSLPVLFVDAPAGQIEPLALAALVFAGVALAAERDRLAGVFAALCAVDPRVGLPVLVAVLCFAPRARAAALATACALGLTALAVAGPSELAVYFARVLPAHAAAENAAANQYSLTYALHALGVANQLASLLGFASYALLALVALRLAPRLAAALQRRDLLAFVPAACSVTGGPFVHALELPAALPAALVLAFTLRGCLALPATLALIVLCVPWISLWPLPPVAHPAVVASFAPDSLASQAWALFASAPSPSAWLAIKLPVWCALATLLVVAWIGALPARSRAASVPSRGNSRGNPRRAPVAPRARTGSNADLA